MDQACKFIFIQRLLQIAEQWQVTFKGLVMQRRQFCLWKPAEQDGGLYKALATGDFNQLEPGQVGQTLVAQEDVEGRLGLRHQTDCLSGVFRRGQLLKTKALEQALGGEQLKGMVLHQQDSKGVIGHRGHTVSEASMKGM